MVPNHHIYTLSFTRMVFIMDAPLLPTLMLTNLLLPTLLVPKYHAKLYIIFKSQLVVRSLWSSQLSNGLSLIMICPNFPGIISKFIFSCFLFCSITHQLIYSTTELSSYASYANQYGPYEVIWAADFACSAQILLTSYIGKEIYIIHAANQVRSSYCIFSTGIHSLLVWP